MPSTAVLSRFDFVYPPSLQTRGQQPSKAPQVDSDGDLVVTRKKDLHSQEGVVLIGKLLDKEKFSLWWRHSKDSQRRNDTSNMLHIFYRASECYNTRVSGGAGLAGSALPG